MKITLSELERYGAQNDIKDFFNNLKNQEIFDNIFENDIYYDFLHFIRRYFVLTDAELAQYFNKCNIQNSKIVWDSNNIKDSYGVTYSSKIDNSNYIRNSNNIKDSNYIYSSIDVSCSENIILSDNVYFSNKIAESKQIEDSNNILKSNNIVFSSMISFSKYIDNSKYIMHSSNLINSEFCTFSKNCNNCLFCSEINDKNYYIFNKEVSANIFFKTKEKIDFLLEKEYNNFIDIDEYDNSATRIKYSLSEDIFKNLSKEFFGFVGTLPFYNERLFLNIFFTFR